MTRDRTVPARHEKGRNPCCCRVFRPSLEVTEAVFGGYGCSLLASGNPRFYAIPSWHQEALAPKVAPTPVSLAHAMCAGVEVSLLYGRNDESTTLATAPSFQRYYLAQKDHDNIEICTIVMKH